MGLNTTLAPDGLISTLELKASHESKANPVTLQLWDPSKPALWVKLLPAKTDGLDSVVSGTHTVGWRAVAPTALASTHALWCTY